jgi:hypothetical protein
MKAMLRYVLCSNVLFLGAALAQAQPSVAGGPGIAGTMAFIQETLNSQGAVSSDAEIARVGVFDALADARACTLSLGTTRQFHVDNADDITVTKSGKKSKKARSEPSQLHVDNLTAKLSFRDVEKLIVAPIGDPGSQALLAVAVDGHAISRSEQPIFLLIVSMTEKVNATGHATGPKNMTKGGARGAGVDVRVGDNRSEYPAIALYFREEDLAQRVATAMIHAVEFCGGGSKGPL